MIRIFNRNRNAIGQFMVALIFLGTFGFLFMFDGFAAKSEAKSCCGGGAPTVTTFAADSSGDFGSEISMDAESSGGCCGGQDESIPSSSNNNGDEVCACGYQGCPSSSCSGCSTKSCSSVCNNCVCPSYCSNAGAVGCVIKSGDCTKNPASLY